MKLLFILFAIACLLLLPMIGFSQAMHGGAAVAAAKQYETDLNSPPVAQPLVRQDDFAAKLAEALDLGTPVSGSAAESMLAGIGIALPNGWIADYPVSPQIVGQLQSSIQTAADLGKLEISPDEALAALQTVSDDFGLPVPTTCSTTGPTGAFSSIRRTADITGPVESFPTPTGLRPEKVPREFTITAGTKAETLNAGPCPEDLAGRI
jgi:hypothetical protein